MPKKKIRKLPVVILSTTYYLYKFSVTVFKKEGYKICSQNQTTLV